MSATPVPDSPRRIVLVGLSGVGKSTVGAVIAQRLGWPLIDTDDLVREQSGKTPAEWIVERGEPAFREVEARAIATAMQRHPAVIATGGGAFQRAASRRALGEGSLICYLDATPATIAQRVRSAPNGSDRPLLGTDIEGRLATLDAERRQAYMHADCWVPAQGLTADEIASRVLAYWAQGVPSNGTTRLDRLGAEPLAGVPAAVVDTGTERYPLWVGTNEIDRLVERLRQIGLTDRRVFLISDATVMDALSQRVVGVLHAGGIAGASYVVPPGEASKSTRVAAELYRWLAGERAERRDVIVALGGGVVGDLAGYVAATYLRGMPFVQIPTSVLAMNDASIGGKVAVDLPEGKNLVGAFHQPRAVIADTSVLRTLPRRAFTEGFAEVTKHALILDPQLLADLERRAGQLQPGNWDEALLADITARSMRLKALVVSADPREQGLRAILNYGHTIGHGIEAASGYTEYLHGEAIAVGMMGAARIAQRMGIVDDELVARQADLLRAFGLPLAAPGVSAQAVLDAMRLDKKVEAGRLRFVLLAGVAQPELRDDVPESLVAEIVRTLVAGG